MSIVVSYDFAEILGLLCAEGSHIVSYSNYWERKNGTLYFRRNKLSERIEFYNKDINLLYHYKKLLMKEFNYGANITKCRKINIGNREIIRKITSYVILGHLSWRLPEAIIKSDDCTKLRFLRGYFDGDGTSSGTVRFFSSNKIGLLGVSKLLENFTFVHTFQGPILKPKRKPAYVLQISRKDADRFIRLIEPVSKKPKSKIKI